ncbi:hypothetical protein HC762_01905 [bacterium]|nr:hypothetical protein [bacterium]
MNPAAGPANPCTGGSARGVGKIREIAKAHEEAKRQELKALDNDALYIKIYYRSGGLNNFHWSLYHHRSWRAGGTKFHIQGTPGQAWNPDHGQTMGALASTGLLAMMRIRAPVSQAANVVAGIITEKDELLSDRKDMTCRIYVQEACERLKSRGLLNFNRWTELEAEVFALGNRENPVLGGEMQSGNSVMPRPVVISAVAS